MVKELIRGFKAQLAGQSLRMVSKGLIILLLTRVFLEPADYGLLFLAMAIFSVAILFCSMGFANSAGRFIAEYRQSDPSQIRHILTTTLRFNLVSISVVGTVLVLFRGQIATLVGEPALKPLLVLGVGYVAFRSLRTFVSKILQGFSRVDMSAGVGAVASVGLLVFVVGFLLVRPNPIAALAGYIVASGLTVMLGGYVLYTRFFSEYPPSTTPEPGLSRRVFEYSLPLTATRSANILDKQIDTILIGFFLNTVAVGYYTLAKQITEFLIAPATSLGFTLGPAFGEQKANGNLSEAARIFESSFKYTVAPYVAAAAGVFLVAEPTVRLVFGPDYLGAVPVIQIFSLYIPLRAIDKITSDGLDYLGRARERAIAKGVNASANFGLNLALIPVFGVVGAAGATVFTYSILVAIELYVIYAELPLEIYLLSRATSLALVTATVMAVVVFWLKGHIVGIPSLVLVVAAGAIVWTVLGSASGLLELQRLRTLFL